MICGVASIVETPFSVRLLECSNHGLEPDVARFHPVFHAARQHGRPRLGIGQCHLHRHQRPARTLFRRDCRDTDREDASAPRERSG